MDAAAAAAGLAGLGACAVLGAAAHALSPPWHPPAYAQRPERRVLWTTTVVALFPAITVPGFAAAGAWEFYRTHGPSLVGPANPALRVALGLSLGYMLFDTFMMAAFANQLRRALKPALYTQLMWHHLLSLVLWPYAFAAERCVLLVAYFLFTEVTNVPLNLRWLVAERGAEGPLLVAVSGLLFLAYSVVRILPIPVVAAVLIRSDDWVAFTPLQRALSLSCAVPLALNVLWYSLLLRGGAKLLRRRPSTDRED